MLPVMFGLSQLLFSRRRGGMSGLGWSLQIANLFLAFCPASLAPECASRLRWLLWEDRTLHLHILSVSSVGTLERPLARSARNPTMNQKRSCASPTQPLLRIETSQFSWSSLTSLAEPNCHYGLNHRRGGRACVELCFSSSFHHLTMSRTGAKTGAQTTPAGSSNPRIEGPEGPWLLDVALGTYSLWSFFQAGVCLALLLSPVKRSIHSIPAPNPPLPQPRHRNSINMPWM